MPTICRFRGIKISINWRDHMPPHFHASYGEDEVIVSILDIEVLEGSMPSKQLKMLLGWAAFHQDELMENWELAQKKQERLKNIWRVVFRGLMRNILQADVSGLRR